MKRFFLITAVLCIAAACKQSDFPAAFQQSETLHMEIKGYTTFTYDPLTCQKAYNAHRKEFRVHSDNMSDFYTVRLDEIPVNLGQRVRGSVSWTTGNNIHNKTTSFEAIRIEGGRIWLWSATNRIAVVVTELD